MAVNNCSNHLKDQNKLLKNHSNRDNLYEMVNVSMRESEISSADTKRGSTSMESIGLGDGQKFSLRGGTRTVGFVSSASSTSRSCMGDLEMSGSNLGGGYRFGSSGSRDYSGMYLKGLRHDVTRFTER